MSRTCNNCGQIHDDEYDRCVECRATWGADQDYFHQYEAQCPQCGRIHHSYQERCLQCRLKQYSYSKRRIRFEPVELEVHPTATRSFDTRLASYLQCSKEELHSDDSYQSKMTFWMAALQLIRTPIRPVERIRQLLIQIQKHVRGS